MVGTQGEMAAFVGDSLGKAVDTVDIAVEAEVEGDIPDSTAGDIAGKVEEAEVDTADMGSVGIGETDYEHLLDSADMELAKIEGLVMNKRLEAMKEQPEGGTCLMRLRFLECHMIG